MLNHNSPLLMDIYVSPKGFTRYKTKFLYPDGHTIEVFVNDDRPDYLTDCGNTMGWLMYISEVDPFEELDDLIEKICHSYKIFQKGSNLEIKIDNFENNLISLVQCIQAISNQSYALLNRKED